MTIANEIKQKLEQFSPGEVFTIQDFGFDLRNQPSLTRYLNRQVAHKKLMRLSKGRYFKPRNSRFGFLQPGLEEIVKDLLIKNGEIIGYISGTPAFAKLGLTTQISSDIFIGASSYRRPTERMGYKIRFFIQRNEITESSIPMLQLLDAIRFFREIPASSPNEIILKLSDILRQTTKNECQIIATLALTYPNYVRALVGAIFEIIGRPYESLKKSLNGVTTYKLNIAETVLPTKKNWNII